MKIHDCSNSASRPEHRGFGGPRENDIIRYLKENAYRFGVTFVRDFETADVVLTNDVFPPDIAKSSIPKIKRMDGTFFTDDLKERNEVLNHAATVADHVIFISEFSERSSLQLYNLPLKKYTIIVNVADPNIFPLRTSYNKKCQTLVAVATDWTRPEKRLNTIFKIAEIAPEWTILIVGKRGESEPANVAYIGYQQTPEELADIMKSCDAMISMSYKDPCPKTVCQGVSCGLPVLWTDSGGHEEIVHSGISVYDNNAIQFESPIPPNIPKELLRYVINDFNELYPSLTSQARTYDSEKFERMLVSYFSVIKSVL